MPKFPARVADDNSVPDCGSMPDNGSVPAISLLEATLDTIPDLIWLKDANGVYLSCNRQFERLYATSRADLVGKTDYDFVDAELADFFRAHDQKAIATGRSVTNEEWLTFAGDRYRGLFETVKTPMYDPLGNLVGVLGVARDITEHKKREEALRNSELRLNVALEATRIGIWDWNVKQDTWVATPSYYTMHGYEPLGCTGDRERELQKLHPDDRDMVMEKVHSVLSGAAIGYQYEARILGTDGIYHWVGVRCTTIEFDADDKPARMLGVRIDIDDIKRARQRVEWLALHDSLTGLPNRVALQKKFSHAATAAKREGVPIALLFVDLDRFKNVNDTLGHRIGDQLLKAVAERLQSILSDRAMVARQGGDEFVIVLPGVDKVQAIRTAEQLQVALSERYQLEQNELVVTPSIGISLFPRDGEDFDTLYRCADAAMYSAKHLGRNRYVFFSEEMQAQSARILELENCMRKALEKDEFSLHYQPQISLHDGRIIGVEVLLRWHSAELGNISPAEFIPVAEDSGQILAIGEWVLRRAAEQMRQWLSIGFPKMTVAVNLSAVQFRHSNVLEFVSRILTESGLPADCLELELTERVAMDDPEGAIATMDALHARGVRTSIDDFGTGYSSLNYLKRFPVYKLKIDQSFVKNMTTSASDRSIVAAIISLGKNLGMLTLAEGVETAEQLNLLQMLGCDEVQGYYLSRPLPAAEFERYVLSSQSSLVGA